VEGLNHIVEKSQAPRVISAAEDRKEALLNLPVDAEMSRGNRRAVKHRGPQDDGLDLPCLLKLTHDLFALLFTAAVIILGAARIVLRQDIVRVFRKTLRGVGTDVNEFADAVSKAGLQKIARPVPVDPVEIRYPFDVNDPGGVNDRVDTPGRGLQGLRVKQISPDDFLIRGRTRQERRVLNEKPDRFRTVAVLRKGFGEPVHEPAGITGDQETHPAP
jgi:hypothetical protein